ncbi:MAG: protein translocase subunit SecD [Pyrinomonadaceae bacterium]|nr:protein translocase subunit SecD [Pyrinomonadaceae bacterium]
MKKRNLLARVIVIAIVTLSGIYAIFGPGRRVLTANDFTLDGVQANIKNNIRLGLDLKGGSQLVMRVKTEDYLKTLTENNGNAAFKSAQDANLPVTTVQNDTDAKAKNYRITITAGDAAKANEIVEAVKNKVDLTLWSQSTSGNQVSWSLPLQAQTSLSNNAVEQAKAIIETRINKLGVTEPTLQSQGGVNSNQLLLQMPGIENPERAKAILSAESKLELMKVITPAKGQYFQQFPTEEAAKQSLGGTVPPNRRVLPFVERDETNEEEPKQKPVASSYVIVENPPIIDGSELRDASAIGRDGGDYQIAFQLKQAGAQKFGDWTGKNVGEYLAVVLNDEVKSAPSIRSQIFDSGEITGRFTKQTAEDLALTLKSGALPAPIEYQEERTVGPSLGADSIRAGITASAAGLVFVMAFMLFYYRGAGVNAVIALILNMLLTVAALVTFGATLTLPGIAGLILGIGMAVDSNVLIFERIREEWRSGKTVANAVDLGFDRAFVTIIDTHITTIISSLLLFMFGTGPIRGFAITLILGLLVNLFSAVYVSRTIYIWLFSRKQKVETISI